MTVRQPTATRRRQIAEAALKIISEQGLRRFTAATVAAEVGISAGTIFRHFPNKTAIVEAGLDVAEQSLFEGFPPEHPDPLVRLGMFFEQRSRVAIAHRHIIRLVQSEQLAFASGGIGQDRINEWKVRSQGFILQCLQEARQQGLIRSDVSVSALVLLVYGALMGLVVADSSRQTGGPTLEVEAQDVWDALHTMIQAPGK